MLIAKDQADAEALYGDLAFLLGLSDEQAPDHGVVFFGADDKSPYEGYSPDSRRRRSLKSSPSLPTQSQ